MRMSVFAAAMLLCTGCGRTFTEVVRVPAPEQRGPSSNIERLTAPPTRPACIVATLRSASNESHGKGACEEASIDRARELGADAVLVRQEPEVVFGVSAICSAVAFIYTEKRCW
jgi:hypothetical protein